jgi:hypothetical protein
MISPLNSVPKKASQDRRVICDLSFPSGKSVKDGIDKEIYMGQSIDLSYPSVDSLALLLKKIGPEAFMFKKDLYKAYRQFKVDPGDIHLLGYRWKERIFIDLSLVMGARSAAQLCQKVTDAIVHLSPGSNLVNYLDDIAGCLHKSEADIAYRKFEVLLDDLGLLESKEKAMAPSSAIEFLGVWFDAPSQTMRVTEDKLIDIGHLLDVWLKKKSASKRDLQSLIGKLQFIAKCVRGSRIFISRLLQTLSTLRKQHHRFRPSSQFKKDLVWWKRFMKVFNGVTLIPDIKWSNPDSHFTTDSCLTGGGGFSDQEYFCFEFPQEVINLNSHILYGA